MKKVMKAPEAGLKIVRKRDGSFVEFDKGRIMRAIQKASFEVTRDKNKSDTIASGVAEKIIRKLAALPKEKTLTVETIQDMVETALMEEGYSHIAKSYILYRERRSDMRAAASSILGLKDDLKLPLNALEVLKRRYLLRDDRQNIMETPSELFRRAANHISQAERNFKSKGETQAVEEKFYNMMRNLEFLPNSPTLMNSGTLLGQLSACFVIPVEDSIEAIFEAIKNMAKIHQTGGGTGFNFSHLRPKGDLVFSTKGEASGPVSFMKVFDAATGVIVQGGRRRGANMGILRCDHPDILEFIESKSSGEGLSNFNISVAVTDAFMAAVKENRDFDLINPRTRALVRRLKAASIFDMLTDAAWKTGDPGLVFINEINRANPVPEAGIIEATNPCGELPLLPYESCNLGSINLLRMLKDNRPDWENLKSAVYWGVRFLDDVIEVNNFPLPEIKKITFANRKIGLGVMGFADMLASIGIPYDSKEAVDFTHKLMKFIREQSQNASCELAKKRGVFPNFKKSVYAKKNLKMRNATVNTIAPTGTISIIAGCSSGIEPMFAVSFTRNVLSGTKLFEVNPLFERIAKERGFYSSSLMGEIARTGSIQQIKEIPADVKRIFITAFDVSPRRHLNIQAAFQAYTDNSVSKTINLPNGASVEDVRDIYLWAHKLKCKGITIFRYGSKPGQVLSLESGEQKSLSGGLINVDLEYSGGCAAQTCA